MCKAQYCQEKLIMNVETAVEAVEVTTLLPTKFSLLRKKTCKAIIQDNQQNWAI